MLILVVGFVFVAVGALWVLQGTNIATGSGMSGESQYAVLGAILALVGVGMVYFSWRRRIRRSRHSG